MNIPLLNLQRQYRRYQEEIDAAVGRVLASGRYILGTEVELFEREFAAYCGGQYCVGVASGTDALFLSLLALGIGVGDEVITSPHSFIATALSITFTGATPVFVDIDPVTYTIDVAKIAERVTAKTKAIIPVHLYGQVADMDPLREIARQHNLFIIEDACQAHGAPYKSERAGTLGHAAAFSFNPPKNLSCYGDGGAIVTNDEYLAKQLRLYREYGSEQKYHHRLIGYNSRLDALQAAILRIKLPHLDEWNKQRNHNAQFYNERLHDAPLTLPIIADASVFHQYVVRVPQRDAVQTYLQQQGIETGIHYPIPIHLQPAYQNLRYQGGDFPVAECAAREILSLPVGPELQPEELEYIVRRIREYYHLPFANV